MSHPSRFGARPIQFGLLFDGEKEIGRRDEVRGENDTVERRNRMEKEAYLLEFSGSE